MKQILVAILMCVFCASAHAANNCTGATYYDADSDTCITCPAGYDYNTDAGKSAATQCQANCAAGKWNGEYTRLEYLSTEEAYGPYIDTGLTAGSNTRVFAQYKLVSLSFIFPISVRDVHAVGEGFSFGVNATQEFISDFNGDRQAFTTITPNTTDIITVDKNKNVCTATIGGQSETVTNTNSTFTTTDTLTFFAQRSAGNVSAGKYIFYSFKMWNNDTLMRDFIPARRNSDNVLGMYDTVTGTFFTNAGTGTFTAGPDVGGGIGACADVGAGYYGAGGTTNFGTAITRTQCTGATYCTGGIQINCPSGYDYNTTAGKTAVTQCQANCTTSQYILPVPSDYTVLDYIESDGTQYINANVLTSGIGLKTEVLLQLTTNSTAEQAIIGNQNGSGYEVYFAGGHYVGTWHTPGQGVKTYTEYTPGTMYTIKSEMTANSITQEVNGEQTSYNGTVTNKNEQDLYLFKLLDGYAISAKAYYIKIWKNGTLVRNFVPVRRNSDSAVGMYDMVSNTFFTNSGTGDFIGGSSIGNGIGGCADAGVGYSSVGGVVNFGSVLARTPNTITIEWDGANGTYQTGSCTYGGGFNTPTTPPTRRGYRFDGWTFVTE